MNCQKIQLVEHLNCFSARGCDLVFLKINTITQTPKEKFPKSTRKALRQDRKSCFLHAISSYTSTAEAFGENRSNRKFTDLKRTYFPQSGRKELSYTVGMLFTTR